MSNKVITINCKKCEEHFKIQEDGSMTCSWGKGKVKNLIEKKGKKNIKCTLKR